MYQGKGADMTSPDPFAKHCRIFLLQHPQVSLPLHLSLCYGGKTTWKRAALRSTHLSLCGCRDKLHPSTGTRTEPRSSFLAPHRKPG